MFFAFNSLLAACAIIAIVVSRQPVLSWSSSTAPGLAAGAAVGRSSETNRIGLVSALYCQCPPSSFTRLYSSQDDSDDLIVPKDANFFIRRAMMSDTGRASELLTDGFFKNTNPFSHLWERLQTYLSVDVDFPQPLARHEIFVACDNKSGRIIGLAEVDARVNEKNARGQNGPYMCNLAVDSAHKRKGIATSLVKQCELEVQQWHAGSTSYNQQRQQQTASSSNGSKDSKPTIIPNSLSLKVRQSNKAAIAMYDKLGYTSNMFEQDDKGETVLVMRKQLPSLLLQQLAADKNSSNDTNDESSTNVATLSEVALTEEAVSSSS